MQWFSEGSVQKWSLKVVKNESKPMCLLPSKFALFSIICPDFLRMLWKLRELAKYLSQAEEAIFIYLFLAFLVSSAVQKH